MRVAGLVAGGLVLFFGTLLAFQKPFREFSGTEYYIGDIPLPPDYNQKTDFAFARLMFPGGPLDGYYPRFQGDYHRGLSLWTQDYPRADRFFANAVGRLTRIHARTVEQVVDLYHPLAEASGVRLSASGWRGPAVEARSLYRDLSPPTPDPAIPRDVPF